MNFSTALLLKKYYFDQQYVPSLHEISKLQLPKADRRSLLAALRYACVFHQYLKNVLPKLIKKASFNLGTSLMMLALEELLLREQPLYAVSHQTQLLLKQAKLTWATKSCIAVLKNIPSLKDLVEQASYEHPLLLMLKKENSDFVFEYCYSHPPLWIRLHDRTILDKIPKDIIIEAIDRATPAIRLTNISPEIENLFQHGHLSYQDRASQFLYDIVKELQAPSQILDCCAAPGGKSALLARCWPEAHFTLTDVNKERLNSLKSNMERVAQNYSFSYEIIMHDWSEQPLTINADFVLVDAPCSGTGVIRRHPDILWNKKPEHLEEFAQLQLKIITHAASCIRDNGYLIYSTCSISRIENDNVIEKFLMNNPDFAPQSINCSLGKKTAFGVQLLPTTNHDGLYFSLLKKS